MHNIYIVTTANILSKQQILYKREYFLVSCPPCVRLPMRNSLMNEVAFVWFIPKIGKDKCDLLSENPALSAKIEFELEAILFVQVVFQLNSDCCTKVLQRACTVSY